MGTFLTLPTELTSLTETKGTGDAETIETGELALGLKNIQIRD